MHFKFWISQIITLPVTPNHGLCNWPRRKTRAPNNSEKFFHLCPEVSRQLGMKGRTWAPGRLAGMALTCSVTWCTLSNLPQSAFLLESKYNNSHCHRVLLKVLTMASRMHRTNFRLDALPSLHWSVRAKQTALFCLFNSPASAYTGRGLNIWCLMKNSIMHCERIGSARESITGDLNEPPWARLLKQDSLRHCKRGMVWESKLGEQSQQKSLHIEHLERSRDFNTVGRKGWGASGLAMVNWVWVLGGYSLHYSEVITWMQ